MRFGNAMRAALIACLAGLLSATTQWAVAADASLDTLRARGTIRIAVYQDFAPFHLKAQGIDVDLAARLADQLGLKLELVPFEAGENLDADLKNMVWKGQTLGPGPADVMLHVPMDPYLQASNPQVRLLAPYMRELVAVARDRYLIPVLASLAPFADLRIGVDGSSISALIMLSTERGRYRDRIAVYSSPSEAIGALKAGEVAAVMALRSELQAALVDAPRFVISSVPAPQVPAGGWVLGLAVDAAAQQLAQALTAAVEAMSAAGTIERIFNAHGVQWMRP